MFDTRAVGRKIAAKRKEMNMTQTELADAMGVSFQAVSNWERGNSMPDISKLPELSGLLQITVDELLAEEGSTELVKHILAGDGDVYLKQEKIPPEAMAEVAPILKPEQTESLFESAFPEYSGPAADTRAALQALIAAAPFVSESFLIEKTSLLSVGQDLRDLAGLAPFLSEESLICLLRKFTAEGAELGSLTALAPFLSREAVGDLTESLFDSSQDISALTALAPFLPRDVLQRIAERITKEYGFSYIQGLFPFLT